MSLHGIDRPLPEAFDRRETVYLIWYSDVAVFVVGWITLTWVVPGGWSTDLVMPYALAWAGAALILLRAVLLVTLADCWVVLAHGLARMVKAVLDGLTRITSRVDFDWEPRARRPLNRAIYDRSPIYYSLLLLGLAGLVGMVVGTGGMVNSPFNTILIATFLLAQYRAAASIRWILGLFVLGNLTAIGTHVLFIRLQEHYADAYTALGTRAGYYILPNFAAALVSTLVFLITTAPLRLDLAGPRDT